MPPMSDSELVANSNLFAAGVLRREASLLLSRDAVELLSDIAYRQPPAVSSTEIKFLRDVVALVDQIEITNVAEAQQKRPI
jgi:chromosome segregation and condensation protein ScpB